MKGIILSGGYGTRLRPLTNIISKQLLPVYDKPMVYYPMSTLLDAGIREIALISDPQSLPRFKELFKEGSQFGAQITYIEQPEPIGIAHALILSKKFIGNRDVTLVLGDNIFHGQEELSNILAHKVTGARLFGYQVSNPSAYGVAIYENNRLIRIDEKPHITGSGIAVTGLYQYDNTVMQRVNQLTYSKRGELEITDLNNLFIKDDMAELKILGGAWLDMGTAEGLLQASNYVHTIQSRQGIQIGNLEGIGYLKGYIGKENIKKSIEYYGKTEYGTYLSKITNN